MGPSTYCMVATCYTTGVGTHGTRGTVSGLLVLAQSAELVVCR